MTLKVYLYIVAGLKSGLKPWSIHLNILRTSAIALDSIRLLATNLRGIWENIWKSCKSDS